MTEDWWDYITPTATDVLERLNTHKLLIEEKKYVYGSSSRISHALKAIAESSSKEEEVPSSESNDHK